MARSNSSALQTAKLLKAFTIDSPEWGITELADHLGYAKSSVHGIVQSLVNEGFLEKQAANNKYSYGMQLIHLGLSAISKIKLRNLAKEVIQSLSDITGETVFLCMCKEGSLIVIDGREADKALRLTIDIGSEMPLDRGSCGKICFSYSSEDEWREMTKGRSFDLSLLENSKSEVRKNGYAFSEEEVYENINAMAAPIFNSQKRLEGMIVIGGLSARMSKEKMHEYAKILISQCNWISSQLP